ncbi:MAG TPA: PIN domain-containing protein [Methylomirabilota bacterium]|nr:PIN domain-containing protein [Methylomirabilota bacterium]
MLAEESAGAVHRNLTTADRLFTSDLTIIECDRTLIRVATSGRLTASKVDRLRGVLAATIPQWSLMRVDTDVVARARRPFPVEPIRTLDAVHLASALLARSAVADLTLLALDSRVRDAGRALGFHVAP